MVRGKQLKVRFVWNVNGKPDLVLFAESRYWRMPSSAAGAGSF